MKEETSSELLGSAHEALEHAPGKRNLRTTTLPLPPKSLNGRGLGKPSHEGRNYVDSRRPDWQPFPIVVSTPGRS